VVNAVGLDIRGPRSVLRGRRARIRMFGIRGVCEFEPVERLKSNPKVTLVQSTLSMSATSHTPLQIISFHGIYFCGSQSSSHFHCRSDEVSKELREWIPEVFINDERQIKATT